MIRKRMTFWQCMIASVPILLLLFMNIQCSKNGTQPQNALEQHIDSLNTYYLKNPDIIKDKLPEVKQLMSMSDSIRYIKGYIESNLLLYQFYLKGNMYSEAMKKLRNALAALEKTNDPYLAGRVYFNYGQFHQTIKNDTLALNYYLKSADGYLKVKEFGHLAYVYRQIGNISYENNNWPLTYKYRRKAYLTRLQTKDTLEIIKDLDNLAIYFNSQGMKDSLRLYVDKVLLMNMKLKNPRDQAQIFLNHAAFLIGENKYEDARKLLMQALTVCDSTNHKKDFLFLASHIYVHLGLIEKNRGDYYKARVYFENAVSFAGTNVPLSSRIFFANELYRINLDLKNFTEASRLMESYLVLVDSNNREINKNSLMLHEQKYEYERIEKERLEKVKKQRIYLFATGIVIVFFILSLILLYSRQRIKIRNARLEKKIQDISLERLNRELASHALNLMRSNERKAELISTLKQQLPGINKENHQILYKVIAGFETDQNESGWKEFEVRFRAVHHGFYEKLLAINPNLTLNEKRLCAFLRLDMTSKEISALTGQSLHAIEQARIRLRKQLDLTNKQVSLSSFLSTL